VAGVVTEVQRADGQVGVTEMSLLPTTLVGGPAVQINLQNLAILKAAEAQSEEAALLLAKQRRAQSAVESVLQALNKRVDVNAMARSCLADVAKATGAQLGLIYAQGPNGAQPRLLAHYLPGEAKPDTGAIADVPALVGRAIAERKALDTSALAADTRLTIQSGSWKKRPRGIAVHPLIFRDEVIGALLLAGLRPFTLEDTQLIQLLSDQFAFVIAHAHVLARSEDMAEELSAKEEILESHDDELLKRGEELLNQDVELLEKNEALKKVDKLKRDFLDKMSREMRAPLERIIHHLISVLSNDEEMMSGESAEHLRAALGEGTAFSRTLNNIVDLWRLKEGQVPVDRKPVHFEAVVDEAIHHVQQVAIERKVTIEKELEGMTGPLQADLGKLTQILTEVIGNAVKFTSNGSVTIVAEDTGGELVCKVVDTGIGMAHDDCANAFDEFFQVDESASSGFHGAGLGLCIAKHLVELMGGAIALESEIGQGTTITLGFPGTDSQGSRTGAAGHGPKGDA
jgi:signal transduction histidine kinase